MMSYQHFRQPKSVVDDGLMADKEAAMDGVPVGQLLFMAVVSRGGKGWTCGVDTALLLTTTLGDNERQDGAARGALCSWPHHILSQD